MSHWSKATDLFHKIKDQQELSDPSQPKSNETFVASKGWFYRFKKRTGIVLQQTLDDQNGTVSQKTFAAVKEWFLHMK